MYDCLVPSGAVGKSFVAELTRLIEAFTQAKAMVLYRLKSAMSAQ